jgi:hypothetical protein
MIVSFLNHWECSIIYAPRNESRLVSAGTVCTTISPLLIRIVPKLIQMAMATECQYVLPQTDAYGHALEHDRHRLGHLGRSPAKLSKGVGTK